MWRICCSYAPAIEGVGEGDGRMLFACGICGREREEARSPVVRYWSESGIDGRWRGCAYS